MAVAERQPDGQHGRLQARPQAVVGRRLLVLVPNEQAEVVPALDTATLFALRTQAQSFFPVMTLMWYRGYRILCNQ